MTPEEKRLRGLEANRRWRAKNKEKERERHKNRVYSQEERSYRATKSREYYHSNKERIAEHRKRYYEANKDRLNALTKEEMLFKNAQSRARRKKLPFNITLNDIVIPKNCPVFPSIELCHDNNKTQDNSPSLDRIIPELGYVKGNIQVISHRANTVKSCGSIEEHLAVIDYIKRTFPAAQNSNQ